MFLTNDAKCCQLPQLAWSLNPVIHLAEHRRIKSHLQVNVGTRQIKLRARKRVDCHVEWLVSYWLITRLRESQWLLPETVITSTVEDSKHFSRVLQTSQWCAEVRIWQRFLFKPYSHTIRLHQLKLNHMWKKNGLFFLHTTLRNSGLFSFTIFGTNYLNSAFY